MSNFMVFAEPAVEFLRLSREGITANPDILVDEIAAQVLKIIDHNIKIVVQRAVEDEREVCAQLAEKYAAANAESDSMAWAFLHLATAIRTKGQP